MANDKDELGLISLFCGPGGMDQGFKDAAGANFVTRLAYDMDSACVETHCHNHANASALVADLSAIHVDEIISEWNRRSRIPPAGVIGGPPCQSFSVSNRYQKDGDPRHKLPEHYARILQGLNDAFNIDFFVFENVLGLVTAKHIQKFGIFKEAFHAAGFNIYETSLDAIDFGVAQKRRRIFVVGINANKYPHVVFQFPVGDQTCTRTVREVIGSLPEPVHFSRLEKAQRGIYHPNHWCMAPKSPKFKGGMFKPGQVKGRSFRVLDWDSPSSTVAYGHREVCIHPNCHRRLSVLEAMLLQGFTEKYVLKGTLSAQIRQVSEAVAPPVAKAIAECIYAQLYHGLAFSNA